MCGDLWITLWEQSSGKAGQGRRSNGFEAAITAEPSQRVVEPV
jgi:hypothetical protein